MQVNRLRSHSDFRPRCSRRRPAIVRRACTGRPIAKADAADAKARPRGGEGPAAAGVPFSRPGRVG